MINRPRHTKQKWADTQVETAESNITAVSLFKRGVKLASGPDAFNRVIKG